MYIHMDVRVQGSQRKLRGLMVGLWYYLTALFTTLFSPCQLSSRASLASFPAIDDLILPSQNKKLKKNK